VYQLVVTEVDHTATTVANCSGKVVYLIPYKPALAQSQTQNPARLIINKKMSAYATSL